MHRMQWKIIFFLAFFNRALIAIEALSCREILQDPELSHIDWDILRKCLKEFSGGTISSNASLNVWRLLKTSFDGIENIPLDAFKPLGYTLTIIPLDELRNLSMERIEIVEAFGAIRNSDEHQGFNTEQITLLAQKVRNEWLNKNPKTYSEYDLISMGEILCHFNISDIEDIHPDAFKYAAEWIGGIKNCPQDRLEAFAKLAKYDEAFGMPSQWSKLDVIIIGNIINGLTQSDFDDIDNKKLNLNHFYQTHRKKNNKAKES